MFSIFVFHSLTLFLETARLFVWPLSSKDPLFSPSQHPDCRHIPPCLSPSLSFLRASQGLKLRSSACTASNQVTGWAAYPVPEIFLNWCILPFPFGWQCSSYHACGARHEFTTCLKFLLFFRKGFRLAVSSILFHICRLFNNEHLLMARSFCFPFPRTSNILSSGATYPFMRNPLEHLAPFFSALLVFDIHVSMWVCVNVEAVG